MVGQKAVQKRYGPFNGNNFNYPNLIIMGYLRKDNILCLSLPKLIQIFKLKLL